VTTIGIEIQVICHECRETMTLQGSNEQGSTFLCPICFVQVTIRLRQGEAK